MKYVNETKNSLHHSRITSINQTTTTNIGLSIPNAVLEYLEYMTFRSNQMKTVLNKIIFLSIISLKESPEFFIKSQMNFQLDRFLRTWNTQIKLFIIVNSMIANIYLEISMLINHISYEYLSLFSCSFVFRLTF